MKVSDFDYHLPTALIADKPVEKRDQSRLLVLPKFGKIEHKNFSDILNLLTINDVLVFNNTKVFPARLLGKKIDTAGQVEILLNHQTDICLWEAIGKNLKVGNKIIFDNSTLQAEVISKNDQVVTVKFNLAGKEFFSEVDKIGKIPLPPYIEAKRKKDHILYENDKERYQTVYAKNTGSVAAPTAGLHFSQELIGKLRSRGIPTFELTLHVGLGTFAHVEAENIEDHVIHKEYYSIDKEVFNQLLELKKSGKRIISVGTTTARVLEEVFKNYPNTLPLERDLSDWTQIYIYPGYKFKFVDALITNFHLPKSSLLFLVSALIGTEKIKQAYKEAIIKEYRFYSYGDAMFIE